MPRNIESQELEGIRANSKKLDALLDLAKSILKIVQQPSHPTLQDILDGVNILIAAEQPEPDNRTTTAIVAFGGTMSATPGTLAVGSTLTASFVPLMADGTVNTTSKLTTAPTWASSDPTIATVDPSSGLVTGVAAGTATITGTAGSFTDSDNTVVGPLDASNTVSDTAPVQRTVSAQVNFA